MESYCPTSCTYYRKCFDKYFVSFFLFAFQKWMVVGYDTYHDARQRKAVGAFIASINPSFSRYYSSVKIHENNEEISPSFKDHLFGALR